MPNIILNIIPDRIFTPFLQGLFEEAAPEKHVFRVETNKPEFCYAIENKNTESINSSYFFSKKYRQDIEQSSCVIFHSLTLEYALAAFRIPKHVPIVWRGWGADYYGFLEAKGLKLVLPLTCQLQTKKKRIFVKRSPKELLLALINNTVSSIIVRNFISRINYFSCCVPDDYDSLQQVLPNLSAKFIPLNYYSCEDIFLHGDNIDDLSGNNILLGNSSFPENNHIEAINMLVELGMENRKVIVPLSYGDKIYRKKVIQYGEKLLGDSFVPLIDFVPLSEYNKIISSCSNVFMNHVRQQAIGNISATLLRGGKVFLRPENPIYKYYTRLGVKLFSCSTDLNLINLDSKVNQDDLMKNKEVMNSIWARKQGLKNVINISMLTHENN